LKGLSSINVSFSSRNKAQSVCGRRNHNAGWYQDHAKNNSRYGLLDEWKTETAVIPPSAAKTTAKFNQQTVVNGKVTTPIKPKGLISSIDEGY
jgi:hypothetical protein